MIDQNYKYKKYRPVKGNKNWYRQRYLRSLRWRKLREQQLRLHPQCQICGSINNLQVHHCRYRSDLSLTILDDLLTICDLCHAQVHNPKEKRKEQEENPPPKPPPFSEEAKE